jgi:Ras of Complex, Roc, domain of DAPkinase
VWYFISVHSIPNKSFHLLEDGQIEDFFQYNTTLEGCRGNNNLATWYATCNKICNELGASIKYRNSIPRDIKSEMDIRSFVKELMSKSSPWRALKLITLGHGRIGKTTLLNKFQCMLDPKKQIEVCHKTLTILRILLFTSNKLVGTKSTIGIDCNTISLSQGEVTIWDFAGQLEYTSTHQFFLSIEVCFISLALSLSLSLLSSLSLFSFSLSPLTILAFLLPFQIANIGN